MSKRKNKGGRPPKITKEVLQKLEDAFMIGASDVEACFYAGIRKSTLYNYQKRHPEFVDRKEALKTHLNLQAKKKIAEKLQDDKNGDTSDAWRWLEKKDPEMRPTQKIEHSGTVTTKSEGIEMNPKMQEAVKLYNEGLKEQVINEIKAMP